MKVVYMAREYPPHVYGGAGVHLEHLAREMTLLAEVEIRCFGDQRPDGNKPSVIGYPSEHPAFKTPAFRSDRARGALQALQTSLLFSAPPIDADVVHCHTWYSHLGGVVAKLAYGVPLVVTVHSLEPRRRWKREQLGRGYEVSSWVERTALEMADAIVAVSGAERDHVLSHYRVAADRVHQIPNGVDTRVYRRVEPARTLRKHGISAGRPFVLFLGRISRQKGPSHFLRAAGHLPEAVQVVLCAAAPDSPEIEAEIEQAVKELRRKGREVIWIRTMLEVEEKVALYSAATVFCCPSIYEPFGIINLEAMACETPVVATAVGGIREVVVPDVTGILISYDPASPTDAEPARPEKLAEDLASGMRRLLDDPDLARGMGAAGRQRVLDSFGWSGIAHRVYGLYCSLTDGGPARPAAS